MEKGGRLKELELIAEMNVFATASESHACNVV